MALRGLEMESSTSKPRTPLSILYRVSMGDKHRRRNRLKHKEKYDRNPDRLTLEVSSSTFFTQAAPDCLSTGHKH